MSVRPHRTVPGPRARALSVVLTLLSALVLLVVPLAATAPARAALGGPVGDTDPGTGLPSYYTDDTGLALQLCLDDDLLTCVTTRADLLDQGADGEGFYAIATADVGGFTAEYALEAAYAGPGAGQEVVFARTRYVGDGVPDSTYVFTGPYGTDTCTTDAFGSLGGSSCTFDEGGANGGDVTSVLSSDRIGPFLTWDTFGGTGPAAPPTGYIGDPNVAHAVTGSPLGYNAVRVTGPGLTGACPATGSQPAAGTCAETTEFLLAGQVAAGPQGAADPVAIDVGSVLGPQVRDVTYTNVGTTDLSVFSVEVTGPAGLSLLATDCLQAPLPSGASCTSTVELSPAPGEQLAGQLVFGDDSAGGSRVVELRARGAASAFAAIPDVDLGQVELGSSAARDVTVTNTGDAPLELTRVELSQPGPIAVTAAGARPCGAGSTTLAVGASCGLRVTGTPTAVGESAVTLLLGAADRPAPLEVPVVVTGVDTTAPVLLGRTPAPGATRVGTGASVVLRFDEAVTGVRASSLQLVDLVRGRTVAASRTSSLGGRRWVLDPTTALRPATRYQVRLIGGTGQVRDLHGVPVAGATWRFRTR